MICHKKSNNTEHRKIKTKKIIWLKSEKSIQNEFLFNFLMVHVKYCKIYVKMGQKWAKMSQINHYSTLFDSIQHYSTFKKLFILHAKQIGWPVLTRFGYRTSKQIPNIFSQLNNLPKLTRRGRSAVRVV